MVPREGRERRLHEQLPQVLDLADVADPDRRRDLGELGGGTGAADGGDEDGELLDGDDPVVQDVVGPGRAVRHHLQGAPAAGGRVRDGHDVPAAGVDEPLGPQQVQDVVGVDPAHELDEQGVDEGFVEAARTAPLGEDASQPHAGVADQVTVQRPAVVHEPQGPEVHPVAAHGVAQRGRSPSASLPGTWTGPSAPARSKRRNHSTASALAPRARTTLTR